jgi:hypothetical protein
MHAFSGCMLRNGSVGKDIVFEGVISACVCKQAIVWHVAESVFSAFHDGGDGGETSASN